MLSLAAIELPELSDLEPRLRGHSSDWGPRARLVRAFRAGLIAKRRLLGELLESDSLSIPFRNSYYVVLRSRNHGPAFWTKSYQVYYHGVFESVRGAEQFEASTISQALPSHAECEAYLRGASEPWPQERQ